MQATTSTTKPITNSVCATCPNTLTVKLKTRDGYVCPACFRKVMGADRGHA